MRIAVDENVPNRLVMMLLVQGQSIVFKPIQGEPDASWLSRAVKKKADFFISADKEVIDYCKWRKKYHYHLECGESVEKAFTEIVKLIENIKMGYK